MAGECPLTVDGGGCTPVALYELKRGERREGEERERLGKREREKSFLKLNFFRTYDFVTNFV